MQIEKTIPLYTNESIFLFKKANVGKKNPKSMLEACMHKVSLLLSAAKKEMIYPLCYLVTVKQQLQILQQTILNDIEEYTVLLEKKQINLKDFSFKVVDTIEILSGNPLIYQITELVEQFDYLFRLLSLLKVTGLLQGETYFQIKYSYVKKLQSIFMDIFHKKLENFPSTTIEEYLQNRQKSHSMVKINDEIDLSVLHIALKLNFLPYMEKEKMIYYQILIRSKLL